MLDQTTVNALRSIAAIAGNLPDDCLANRGGPNDALHRGQMLVTVREIAREILIQNGHEPPSILGKETPKVITQTQLLRETIQEAISDLLEGDYNDGSHPLVGDVINRLREAIDDTNEDGPLEASF